MAYYVYMMTNEHNNVLYTGVTNDLERRVYEHRNHIVKGFTSKYNVEKLVYFEVFNDVNHAIGAEKRIKGWTRAKKNALIESINPEFWDLALSSGRMGSDR